MLRYGEMPGDAFSQLDPFGHRGGKAGNANAANFDPLSASSATSEVATDAAADDKWMVVPQKKKSGKAAMARDASNSFTNPFTAHNANTSTMSTGYDALDLPTTPAPRNTGTRAAASVTASTAFEEGIASGKYGRPGHTTPRGDSSREWYKPVSTCLPFPSLLSLSPCTPHLHVLTPHRLSHERMIHSIMGLRRTLRPILRLTPLLLGDPRMRVTRVMMSGRRYGAATALRTLLRSSA